MADDDLRGLSFMREILARFDTRSFIAISLTLSMIALAFLLAIKSPETDAFKVMLGALLTVGFASAIGWYFNSSAGSEKKDDALLGGKIASTAVNAAAPGTITTVTTPPATVTTETSKI